MLDPSERSGFQFIGDEDPVIEVSVELSMANYKHLKNHIEDRLQIKGVKRPSTFYLLEQMLENIHEKYPGLENFQNLK